VTEYQIIDAVCDSVNPILLAVSIGLLLSQAIKRQCKRAFVGFGFLVIGLGLVYGIQALDSKFLLWSAFGGDYSTHTAFAVAVSFSIAFSINKSLQIIGVLVIYMAAMLYQQYHSVFDMVSTLVTIGVPLLMLKCLLSEVLTRKVAV